MAAKGRQASAAAPAAPAAPAAATEPEVDLPELVNAFWCADQQEEEGAEEDVPMYKAKGLFKNDYLAYCRIFGIRPHPQLLPALPSAVPPATDLPSYKAIERHDAKFIESNPEQPQLEQESATHFDFTVQERLSVRGMAFGHADMLATLPALKACKHLRCLSFSRAALSAGQVWDLALALPHTAITELVLEFNPLLKDEGEPDVPAKHRVLVPKDCLPLPSVLYPSEFVGEVAPPTPSSAAPVEAAHATQGAPAARASTPATASRPASRGVPAKTGAADATTPAVSGAGTPLAGAHDATAADAKPQKDFSNKLITYGLPGKTAGRIWSLFFKRFQKLQRLSLRGNDIGPSEAVYIGDAILHNESLAYLNLSVNPLLHEGVSYLLGSLQECKAPVSFLGLASVGMDAQTVSALPACFRAEPTKLSYADMRARALREERVAAELIMDINGLGLRELVLPAVSAALDAAEVSKAAAAAAPVDPKAKGAAKPAAGPPASQGRVKGAHPDSDFITAFRLVPAHEVGAPKVEESAPAPAASPAAAPPGKPSPKGKAGAAPAPAPAPAPVPEPAPAPMPIDPESRSFTVTRPGLVRLVQIDLTGNAAIRAEGLVALAKGLAPLYPSKEEEVAPAPPAAPVPTPSPGAGKKGAAAAPAPAPAPAPPPKPAGPALKTIAAYSCVPALHSVQGAEEKKDEEVRSSVVDYASERSKGEQVKMARQAVEMMQAVGVAMQV